MFIHGWLFLSWRTLTSKNQSNPTTLTMSVVSMFVASSDSAVITVKYLIHSCMSLFPCSDDNTSFMKLVQNSFLYNISKNSRSLTSVAFSAVVHLKQAFGSFQVLFELFISLWKLHVAFAPILRNQLPKQEQFEFKGVEFK
ncbi:uncharacterized protein LOC117612920 [Prunus dulcis]|uniref:uncharacterized protein LOC117612920 n=1 Tax=Prunus dulcis TaxID=3755 RepID=UPI0014836BE7|nr:uncharacterized protein LOC117612920 [Prunus dulcis]